MKILEFKNNTEINQELESLDCECIQMFFYNQMSENQKVKFLKGQDIEDLFDRKLSFLHKARKKASQLKKE